MSLRRRRHDIPSPDAASFRRVRLRTTATRVLLVALAVSLAAAGVVAARGLEPRSNELVPGGRSGVIVLDVSLSIVDRDYGRVRAILERLIAADNPMGVVLFSDTAYEVLPPRTPAKELRPFLRFFTLANGELPPNPWSPTFSAGTQISVGLEQAEQMLRRDRVSPASVLLMSDLNTAPTDLQPLGRAVSRLQKAGVEIRVVPLSASSDGVTLFEGLLGPGAFVDPVEPSGGEPRVIEVSLRGELPLALLLAAGLVLLVLAAHERFVTRLAVDARPLWRRA